MSDEDVLKSRLARGIGMPSVHVIAGKLFDRNDFSAAGDAELKNGIRSNLLCQPCEPLRESRVSDRQFTQLKRDAESLEPAAPLLKRGKQGRGRI
jgi:hypothetical protein